MNPAPAYFAHRQAGTVLARQRAFTLIELMVSMTISLVLLMGLALLFSSTSLSFRVQDEFARLQENGTAALRYLGDDLRMAGFYGTGTSVASVKLDNLPVIEEKDDCGAELAGPPKHPFALDLGVPIAVGSDPTPFPCIDPANYYPDSPVIVLRGATSHAINQVDGSGNMSAALAAEVNYAKTIYVQSSPTQEPNTIVFRGDSYAALRAASLANIRILTGNQDAPIFEYQTHVYYIRPCSRPTGVSGTKRLCQAADDGGHPIPTLVRQELANQQMQEIPLVEGIERLSLSYGLDINGDGIPDQYTAAPAPGDWPKVIAVRIAVLVRSTAVIAGQDDSGKNYDLGGGVSFSCSTSAGACSYLRQVYSQTVQLRNCALRRSAGAQQC